MLANNILVLLGMALLIVLAGMFKAIMDTLQFHYDSSIFKNAKKQDWWNPIISWNSKNTLSNNPFLKWLLRNPLVFVTDAWHLFGFFYMLCWIGVVSINIIAPMTFEWYWGLLISLSLWVIHSTSFHIFFTYIFIAKKKNVSS